MKPFDLEAAKAGAPVQTRDGRKVRILCFDRNDEYCIVGLIKYPNKELVSSWLLDGTIGNEDDLFMAPVKREYWVNIYKNNDEVWAGHSYISLQNCISKINNEFHCIGQIKIHEEEV